MKSSQSLPDGWSDCPLSSVLKEIDIRVADLPPDEAQPLDVLSLTKRAGLVPQSKRFKKRVATENVDSYKVVRLGWIVYNPYVIWEGAIHALRRDTPGIVSPVYPVWERTEPDYGYLDYLLRTPELIAKYEKLSAGAVNRRRSIKRDDFLKIRISLPPLLEQRKIATVLSQVRQAIEQQERLIALTTELKKSLMQKLFTEGLRGERQKQTEIGPVPESWGVVKLEEICGFMSGGTPSKRNDEFWVGSIPWVSPKDMKRPRLSDVTDHISEAALEDGSALAPAGSVFVVVRGMILAKDVPVALAEVPMAFNQDMKAVIAGPRIIPLYLLYAMVAFKQNLFRKVGRSAHGTMTLLSREIERFIIPLPDMEIQEEIANAIATVEQKHELHRRKRDSLSDFFRTLLHQLMTAQIRVHDLDLSELGLDCDTPMH